MPANFCVEASRSTYINSGGDRRRIARLMSCSARVRKWRDSADLCIAEDRRLLRVELPSGQPGYNMHEGGFGGMGNDYLRQQSNDRAILAKRTGASDVSTAVFCSVTSRMRG